MRQLEKKIANLEGGDDAVAFASGMAAISGLMLHLLQPGDHVVYSDVCYAGQAEFIHHNLSRLGIRSTGADGSDPDDVRRAIRPETRLVHVETPGNPILRLTDIAAVAQIAHDAGAVLMVDSTLATPIATQPLSLGADYVIHSMTKYLGGHGDALGGIVVGQGDRIARLRNESVVHLGGTLSPFNAWLILRGIATLPIRMAAHAAGATVVAQYLEGHPRVRQVIFPGLASHPQADLVRRQMASPSGMIAFRVEDGERIARRVATDLEVIHYAVSLGHQRSLLVYLPTDAMQRDSFQLDADHLARYRRWAGDGMFRMSVGLEDPDDLCQELEWLLRD